ncbi:GerMN domain-containing protein [Phormidium sp. LEGE 05292]|uniref:GerMN domain-containing protein n=1 Tax=[Phormidium] sp. LEGE 05292 TaxID=767427 RepID=UPI0018822319|nr:GerMN domain-containing protein [Phormidium sp. LEGE 05292]MBE9228459.1 GerMN domain-containing protein [Phormidium sp. LEGE 05292]
MQQRQTIRQLSLGAKGAIAILLLAITSGAVLTSCNPNTPETTVPTTQPTKPVITPKPNTPTATTKAETKAEIYLIEDKNGKFQLVARPVAIEQKATNQAAILEQSFNRLLAQSNSSSATNQPTSAIPKGTKLRSIKVDKDNITVDLSPEFTSGGGSASMTGRLGQVIYTATSLNPKAKVFLSVNGKPLETLGGEGLEITQPITRESFQKDFPL